MVLTAEDIVAGVATYKEIKIESAEDTVFLRPLSKGEWEKVNNIRQESLGDYTTNEKAQALSRNQRVANIESKLAFNIKENGVADFNAKVEAIYMSMDNPGYDMENTRESIKNFPSDIFDEIYNNVREISGIKDEFAEVTLEDEVDDFPED